MEGTFEILSKRERLPLCLLVPKKEFLQKKKNNDTSYLKSSCTCMYVCTAFPKHKAYIRIMKCQLLMGNPITDLITQLQHIIIIKVLVIGSVFGVNCNCTSTICN